ncbi:glycosyltransferase [Tolypothrix tenuis PCC 7101]|uniref:Glycosyltransferase n=1 Tax=Tolypothrix tenuis PCC 7101 TaxID=231146 RepID=A0A1Z4N841_9CYAN|nr:glycosyltransferase [Aulosira sp. FACHB-113]BAZ01867.1 glycosyltransferase [Tolypothrix tenuis PCC 7101]BAZ74208.1 glycosyltransferase [Aulosira laxa NIES-50]
MRHNPELKNFHLWFPNIFEFKGGIQVYSAFFLQALQSIYPESQYNIFIKQDVKGSSDITYLSSTKFYFTGAYSNKIRTLAFATKILSQGLVQYPDLVIAAHINFSIAAYLLKVLAGIPYWINVYGLEVWELKNPILKKALQNADRILSISGYTRDRLIKEQNIDADKISLLPCTFDASNFKIASKPTYLLDKYQLTPEQPVILTVARLAESERYKGYDQILQALSQIREIIPDVHYIIVGKGKDQPRIEKVIANLGIKDCVTLAGFVPDEELCDYYNLCDVFAMPSKREGFGIVYLEALACGKPVLAGNQDGAIDALCHGELGALVNPDDVGEIAKTLIQILQGTYHNHLIYQPENLRQKVIDTFGFERFQRTLDKHLNHHLKSTINN